MINATAHVKGQKVISPSREGFVENVERDQVSVRFESGEVQIFTASELEDDSDAG
jgi:hypothetical protein